MKYQFFITNNHINDIIVSNYDFKNEDLKNYYISFLKLLSLKLNDRIYIFFNENADNFPLYTK